MKCERISIAHARTHTQISLVRSFHIVFKPVYLFYVATCNGTGVLIENTHTHTHTHTHRPKYSNSQPHSHILTRTHPHSLTLSHTRPHPYTHSHTHNIPHSCSQTQTSIHACIETTLITLTPHSLHYPVPLIILSNFPSLSSVFLILHAHPHCLR